MTRKTSPIASTSVWTTFLIETFTKGGPCCKGDRDLHILGHGHLQLGQTRLDAAAAVRTALAPGDIWIAAAAAGLPLLLTLKDMVCAPSSTRATSPRRRRAPSVCARSGMAAKASGVDNWPRTVSGVEMRVPDTVGSSPTRPRGGSCVLAGDRLGDVRHGEAVGRKLGRIDPDPAWHARNRTAAPDRLRRRASAPLPGCA